MTYTIQFACSAFKKSMSISCFRKQTLVVPPVGYFDNIASSYCNGIHYRLSLFQLSRTAPIFFGTSKTVWPIRSSADGNPSSSSSGTTRLIKILRNLQINLDARIQELRKNLPVKFLFFLVGFYSATAFSTVIGQTGDWDILSAALAVFVVEGIGALMYRTPAPLLNRIRNLIIMFNYWKAGLSLGLFLDSFKY